MRQSAACCPMQLRAAPHTARASLSRHISSVTRLAPSPQPYIRASPPLAAVSRPHYGHFPAPFIRRCYSVDDQRGNDGKKASLAPMKKDRAEEADDDVVIRLQVPDASAEEDPDQETDLVEATKAEKSAALRADINLQGGEYFRLGMYDEAEAAFNKVLEMIEEELGPEHIDVGTVLNNLGMVQANKGSLDDALHALQRCLAVRETGLGAADEGLVTPLNNLGLVCKRRKELDAAYGYFDRALSILDSLRLQDDMQFGTILNNAASVRHQQGRILDARDLLRRAAEVMAKDHPELSVALGNLFFLERELKEWDTAAETGERLTGVLEENEADASVRVRVLLQLADVFVALGQRTKALKLLEQAKQLGGVDGPRAPDITKRIAALT